MVSKKVEKRIEMLYTSKKSLELKCTGNNNTINVFKSHNQLSLQMKRPFKRIKSKAWHINKVLLGAIIPQ